MSDSNRFTWANRHGPEQILADLRSMRDERRSPAAEPLTLDSLREVRAKLDVIKREHNARVAPLVRGNPRLQLANLTGVLLVTEEEAAEVQRQVPIAEGPCGGPLLQLEVVSWERMVALFGQGSGGHGSERQPPGAASGDHDPDCTSGARVVSRPDERDS